MSGNQHTFPQAETVAEVNIHLGFLQRDVAKLVDALPLMATKADIDALARRLDGYATQDEVRALRGELDDVRRKMDSDSVQSRIDRWGNLAQRAAAIIAFLAGGAYFIHGLLESVKVVK